MPAVPPPAGCPPGLECLSQVDKIQIHQQIDLLEVLIHIGTNNKYEIKNSLGQQIYVALEDSNLCTQNCCGPCRPFTLRILDLLGREVITLKRPYRCATCCCNFYQQEMRIYIPPGPPVGYVIQTRNPCLSEFMVQNEKREDVLKITGPCLVCSCCADVDFEIKSLDEENVVGKISKQWTGFVREVFTDYTQFDISFLVDVDVKMKAVILGACFLIDFMFFENKSCPYIFCTFLQINPWRHPPPPLAFPAPLSLSSAEQWTPGLEARVPSGRQPGGGRRRPGGPPRAERSPGGDRRPGPGTRPCPGEPVGPGRVVP
ncbi:phospholipid scramblase 2-like [Saccopteryx leptura]|uniref:phospholipid scramblase 2-like n=1 Tax=Saccopteryx leptura TaxID=249018 RepID=UPI00339C7EE0